MTIEKNLFNDNGYTPFTFIRNARTKGLGEAWRIDKELTAQRNPNLARAHNVGMISSRETGRNLDRAMRDLPNDLSGYLLSGIFFSSKVCSIPLSYTLGAFFGSLGMKPEQTQYENSVKQGETQ